MNVLIGCEHSGVVREAFRRLGHDAYSNDILPADDASPFHIKGDVFAALAARSWDLAIFHPPCTYLTVSGVLWCTHTPANPKPNVLYGQPRIDAIASAVEFVKALAAADIPKIAIENPIGMLSSRWRKPDQVIQPWMFGHPEFKATCLWLLGLPPLRPTNRLDPPKKGTAEFKLWSKVHYASPGKDRWKKRSKTLPGIADAMAAQWSI